MSEAEATRPGSPRGPELPRPGTVGDVHAAAVVAVVVGLVVVVVLAAAAWSTHQATEDRIMERRTREAAAVFTAGISSIESSASSAADVVDATEGDRRSFETLMRSMVGEQGTFVSASIWALDGAEPRLTTTVGEEPLLAQLEPGEIQERLSGGTGEGLRVVDLVRGETPRLGYTYRRQGHGPVAAYLESALPENRTSVAQADSAFADLRYAVYLGERDLDHLVVANTSDLPLTGRRSVQSIPFGDTELVLVMAATSVLGSKLGAILPWLILGLGALLAALFGVLYERVLRRRDEAAVLAAEVARVAEDNARLYSEQRSVAQTLQQSLLLEVLPEVPGLELAARYEAGAEGVDIGGDWYDVIPREEDCVLLVVGDVSGRGVRAATVMAALRHSVRALALQGDPAGVILTKLSRLVSLEQDGHFATVLIVEVDPRRGSLAVASAGHARPLLLTDLGAEFIEVDVGVPVGVSKAPSYRTASGQLQPGSTLLGFTDGLFERRGETVDTGLERLRAAAEAGRGVPLEDLLDELVARLAGTPQDDAAILGVRWPNSTTRRS